MKNKNTLSKFGYVYENLLYGFCVIFIFYNSLFRTIHGFTYAHSIQIFWGIMAVSLLLGIAVTWKKRRNFISVFVNIMFPLEVYTIITYSQMLLSSVPFIIISAAASVLSVGYTVLVMKPKIKNHARTFTILFHRIARSLLGIRTIVASCFAVLLIHIGFSCIFGISYFSPSASAENKSNDGQITIANNIETISQLEEPIWHSLSIHEKLNVLQTVANIESSYLGLPHELNLVLSNLSENTLACYNDSKHLIEIDTNHLEYDSAHELLDSVCHEARHAYQHRLCDVYDNLHDDQKQLLCFYKVPFFKDEFENYVDGSDNILEYYCQQCEADAREYAEDAVSDYYSKIRRHLKTISN